MNNKSSLLRLSRSNGSTPLGYSIVHYERDKNLQKQMRQKVINALNDKKKNYKIKNIPSNV